MSFENWIPWLLPIFVIFGPFIFKWYRKREADSTTNLPNEAPVRWRQFDISQNKQPFLGWAGASTKALLRVSSDGIYCADIAIPFTKIKKAIAYSPKDHPFGKSSYSIFRLETNDTVYDFSISPFRLAKFELPFEVVYEETQIVPKVFSKLMLPGIILISIIIMLASKSC